MSAVSEATPPDQIDPGHENSLSAAASDYIAKVRGGELGSLPAVLGLIALVIIFGILQGKVFLTSFNFANLLTQR